MLAKTKGSPILYPAPAVSTITPLTEPALIDETSAIAEPLPKSLLTTTSSETEFKMPSLVTVALLKTFKAVNSCTTFLVDDTPCIISPAIKLPISYAILNSIMLISP